MNSESMEYFLCTKEAKKATRDFKKIIKEMGLQLRIKSENENNRNYMIDYYELTFVIAKKYERFGSRFRISTNSKNNPKSSKNQPQKLIEHFKSETYFSIW